ncbi:hypothetical protein FHR71_005265 [Methylobacterium sp. RAS18]|nr:hypothetical protein [Methylobacterium sp. RAS18]
MDQAVRFVDVLVNAYEQRVATGEVGGDGSGRASGEETLSDQPPRILLYGRVQSGKTVGMMLTSALCLDNGFRVVVVLTADNVDLVKQTTNRFKNIEGPKVLSATKEGAAYEWRGQESVLRDLVDGKGLVVVCAKNSGHLEQMLDFLADVDASAYPVLVLDDEADAATPDTTQAARAAGHASAPDYPSPIHRRVVSNEDPDEYGLSLGQRLPHSLYVPVTATPFVLFLQSDGAKLRPTETFLLEPGQGYCGGREFFGSFDPDSTAVQPPPLVLIQDGQSDFMRVATPEGLARSIDYFVLAAAARAHADQRWPSGGFKHLSHTSARMDDHDRVSDRIRAHLDVIAAALDNSDPNVAVRHFAVSHAELSRSVADLPALADLFPAMSKALRQAEVLRINSKAGPREYGPRLNFLIGGNILGRGLTIDDLLVTYYIREAKTSQMDTVWQHARMYGYRSAYLDYMRVYLPKRLAENFHRIHLAEEDLRAALANGEEVEKVLISVPRRTRPTRPNALVEDSIVWLRAGRAQINPHSYAADAASGARLRSVLAAAGVPIGEANRQTRPTFVPMETAKSLVRMVAVPDDDGGIWQEDLVLTILQRYQDRMPDGCIVYVRSLEEEAATGERDRARLSQPEVNLLRARSPGAPSLCFLYVGDPAVPAGWYPTLVMPQGAPTLVFSVE